MAVDGRQRSSIDNALAVPFGGQEIVLHGKKFPFQRHGRSDIHQTAEQPPLAGRILGKFLRLRLVFGHLCQQHCVELSYLFQMFHKRFSPVPDFKL